MANLMVMAIAAILSGADSWVACALFARANIEWFRKFLSVETTPSHDTFSRVFSLLNPRAFEEHFVAWTCGVAQTSKGQVVAIDGKCLRRSLNQPTQQYPFHIVSAWAHASGVALAQTPVDAKSNEIPAARALIAMLDLTGTIVTADALHCVPATVEAIRASHGDYILAVKANRKLTLGEIKAEFAKPAFPFHTVAQANTGHGRIETRQVEVMKARAVFAFDWEDASSLVRVHSARTVEGKTTTAVRYYISSLAPEKAQVIADAVRSHWSIENSQHWVLDMVFREDECRVRDVNAAANFSMLRRIALNTLKADTSKGSVKGKRQLAGWSEPFRDQLLGLGTQ